jgi:hypothetical protein
MNDTQKQTKYKPGRLGQQAKTIVLSGIGIASALASLIPYVQTAPLIKTIVPMICGAAILAGFIFLEDFVKSFKSLRLVKNAEYLGIRSISRSDTAHELIINGYIEQHNPIKDLRIMAYSGAGLKPLLDNGYLRKIVVEDHARVKILLASPGSECVRELEDIEGEAGRISRGIEQTMVAIARVQNEVKEAEKDHTVGSITVRRYNTQIRSAITLVNDEAGFLTLSLAPFFGSNTASFELCNTGGESLFNRCSGHFNAVWDKAT